ncbi:MAG TPA: UDP-N-acetylglucosamine 1-carboxyvinyltransferase [Clostridiales bacterium]|nr:UDP-N-acetylglucosamine 1-carboxyvinyltransferase [Clostridiales bacterium]
MDRLSIYGPTRLKGEVTVAGAKNSVLPILAASIISDKEVVILDCPKLLDVDYMLKIMTMVGCKVKREGSTVVVDSSGVDQWVLPDQLVKEMRSSVILLGSILGKLGKVQLTYPGGCEIGLRPIDLHLKGLKQLGTIINEENGHLYCEAKELVGTDIHLDYPSVGATENIMLASVFARGRTIIRNAAKEPEIVDLQDFLNVLGCNIYGAGTSTIYIEGFSRINRVEYRIIPDRIVAGTYMLAAAITQGYVLIKNIIPQHIHTVLVKLKECGCDVTNHKNSIRVRGKGRLKAKDVIKTLPYPGFPTDMQAPMMAAMSVADGTTVFIETIFENRYKHVQELVRMGAQIHVDGRTAIVKGVERLNGCQVTAHDLRGGAALVLAGLAAHGNTVVNNVKYIDRGYDGLDKALNQLGARIDRISCV